MSDFIHEPLTPEGFFAYVDRHPDKRFDFIDGALVEVSPKPLHGYIQAKLVRIIGKWLDSHAIGHVHTEVLHVLNAVNFIPDLSVNAQKAHDQPYFDAPPLLVVEIRSDTQSRAAQRRKAESYRAQGTPVVLLVFPGEQIEVFAETPIAYTLNETVRDIPGFAGLEITVADLFD